VSYTYLLKHLQPRRMIPNDGLPPRDSMKMQGGSSMDDGRLRES